MRSTAIFEGKALCYSLLKWDDACFIRSIPEYRWMDLLLQWPAEYSSTPG